MIFQNADFLARLSPMYQQIIIFKNRIFLYANKNKKNKCWISPTLTKTNGIILFIHNNTTTKEKKLCRCFIIYTITYII